MEWRRQDADVDSVGICELFERQATRTPDSACTQFGSIRLTYAEVNARANQLARLLIRKGVGASSIVAICLDRSNEMIVAMLAVLKAGGAYLPIDPSYPLERVAMLLEDAEPTVLVTEARLLNSLPQSAAPRVLVDDERPSIDAEATDNLGRRSSPEDLAYVIYTSGSTGRPKGVLVTHRNVVRLLSSTDHWFRFGPSDVWTKFHSYAFDFSVWEIWGCLLTGGRLVIVPHWVTRSPTEFRRLLSDERVTVLNQTPAAFYQLIEADAGNDSPLALRYVIFGGEALSFGKLRPWMERHGDQKPQLVNMYGITETTVHVTYRPVNIADTRETRSLIGEPIPDLELYVLDAERRPVPVGAVGEIYVGGAGVARGYLNRPGLTAERFVVDPFAKGIGARMYKSGDLARVLDDGDLEYLGRGDDQVKIRGFRIELGEIEAALAELSGIRQTTACARKDNADDLKLVAYYVAQPGYRLTASALRDALRSKLPSHMIPHAFVEVDAIPLTVNGKVDRAALPPPNVASKASEAVRAEPARNELEQLLASVWSDALGCNGISLNENFFDLGADSLMVASVHARLQEALRTQFPITDLFEFTTIATLCRRLQERERAEPEFVASRQQGRRQRAAFARQRERRSENIT